MDKKYLHKVLDQIVSETRIDYDMVQAPFVNVWFLLSNLKYRNHSFFKHCQDVYGLTKEEMEYVWEEYRKIIIRKGKLSYKKISVRY